MVWASLTLTAVVVQALILAHEIQKQYSDIVQSCRGIVFLGTPHRGSEVASWANMITAVTKAAGDLSPLRNDLLRDLRKSSVTLKEISSQFVHRTEGLQILSFVEREYTGPLKSLVCAFPA